MCETKILIVDDEAPIRALLRAAVTAPGLSIYEAECSDKALALAAEHAPFTLVVTDVVMPGMDGIDMARRLQDEGQAKSFLFMSGYCDSESLTGRVNGLHTSGFIGKPFSIPDLLNAVKRFLQPDAPESRSGAPALADQGAA